MWNRLTSYTTGLPESGEASTSEVGEAPPLPDDVRDQIEQQQVLIEQLKNLVRENETQLVTKEKLLEDTNTKLQKFKLQSKAKIAQLSKLKDKAPAEKVAEESDESTNGSSQGSPTPLASDQGTRGKALLLKKQLQESKLKFEQREKENQQSQNNLQGLVEKLQTELDERNKLIEDIKSGAKAEMEYKQQEEEFTANKDVSELYAQIVYKDKKIVDLNDKILESERRIMDLQENLREKDEVLSARNKAIQLMSDDLSKKGKVAVDNLDETRTEMRQMQEVFAQAEARWNHEKTALKEIITTEKEKFTLELSEKEDKLKQIEESMKTLEQTRFDLSTRNAELQTKIVKVQESFEKWKESHSKSVEAEMSVLKTNLEKKEAEITKLNEKLEQVTSDVDNKILKARAKERSKLKALQKEMDELKKNNSSTMAVDNEDKIAELGKHIAELEEEKGSLLLKVMELEELCKSEEKWTLERSTIEQTSALSESEIEKHKFEKQELEDRLTLLTNERDEAMNEISKLNRVNEELETKLNVTEDEFSKHKNSVNELESRMLSYEDHIKMLELNQQALAEEIVEKENVVLELQVALKAVQDDKVALEMRVIEFEEQREADDKEKGILQKEINRLKQKIEDENVPVLAIEKEKEALEKELTALKVVESQQATRLNEFQNKISQLISETERLQDNNAIASEEMEKLEEEISYKCSEIDNKNELLQAQSYRLDEMDQALENSEDHIHNLERKLEEKSKILDELANKEVDLENEKAQLEDALKQSQVQIGELRETIKKTVESMENLLQQTLAQKERELGELNEVLKQKETAIESTRLENNKLQRELEHTQENQSSEGAKVQTKISSLLEQIAELESECSSLQMSHNNLTKDYEKLSNDNQTSIAHQEHYKASLNEKINEIEKLAEENQHLLNNIKEKDESEVNYVQQIAVKIEECNNLESKLVQLKDDSNKLLEEKISEVQKLDAVLSIKDDQLIALEKDKESLSQQLFEMKNVFESSEKGLFSKASQLEEDKSKLMEEIEVKNQEIHGIHDKVSHMEVQISQLSYENSSLLGEINVKIEELNTISAKLEHTIEDNESMKKSILEKDEIFNQEKKITLELYQHMEESKVLWESKEREFLSKISQMDSVSNQVKFLHEKERTLQQMVDNKVSEFGALQSENEELRMKATELSNRIVALSEQQQNKDGQLLENQKQLEEIDNLYRESKHNIQQLMEKNSENINIIQNLNNFLFCLQDSTSVHLSNLNDVLSYEKQVSTNIKDCVQNIYCPHLSQNPELRARINEFENEICILNKGVEKFSLETLQSKDILNTLDPQQIEQIEKLEKDLSQIGAFRKYVGLIHCNLKHLSDLSNFVNEENSTLRSKVEELKSNKEETVMKLSKECENLNRNLHKLQNEYSNLQSEKDTLGNEVTHLKTTLDENEKCSVEALKLSNNANAALEEEKRILTNEKQSLENSVATLQSALEKCKSEMSLDLAQQHDLQLKVQQEEDKNIDLVTQLKQTMEKLESHIEKVSYYEMEHPVLCKKLEELEAAHDKLCDETNILRNSNKELSVALTSTKDEIDAWGLKCRNLEDNLRIIAEKEMIISQNSDQLQVELKVQARHLIVLEEEKMALDTQLKETLDENWSLKERSDNLTSIINNLKEHCSMLERQNQELKDNIEKNCHDSNMQKELEDCKVELSEVKRTLEDCTASKNLEIETLLQEKDTCFSQMEIYRNQCLELQNCAEESVKNLGIELEAKRTHMQDLQSTLSDQQNYKMQQQQRIEELENLYETLMSDMKKLKISAQQTEQANESLEGILHSKTSELEGYLKNMTSLQNNNEKLENQVLVLSQELGTIQNLTENMEQKLQEVQKSLTMKELEVETQKMEMQKFQEGRSNVDDQIKTLMAEIEIKNNQIDHLNSSVDELNSFKNNYSIIEKDLKEFKIKNEHLQQELNDILKSQNVDSDEKSVILSQVHSDLQNAVSERNLSEKEKNHLEEELSELKIKLDSYKESHELQNNQIEELSLQLNDLLAQRNALQLKFSELQAEVIQEKEEQSMHKVKVALLGTESTPDCSSQPINDNEALMKEISDLKSEIERNKAKMGRMLLKLKQFKEKNDNLTKQVKEASELGNAADSVDKLMTEVERLKQENALLSHEVEESKVWKERFNNLEVLCENLNKEMQEFTDKRTAEINLTQIEKTKINNELQMFSQSKCDLENELSNLKYELRNSHSVQEQLSNETAILREQSEMLISDNETYQTLIENLKQSKRSLETELQRLKESYSKDLKAKDNELQNYLRSMENFNPALNEKDNIIAHINEQYKIQTENYQKLQEELKSFSLSKHHFETENENLRLRLKDQASNNTEREMLVQELNNLKDHYERQLVEEQLRNKQQTEKVILVRNVESAPHEDNFEGMTVKVANLERELLEAKKYTEALLVYLSEAKQENENLIKNRSNIEMELSSLSDKLQLSNNQQRQLIQELSLAKQNFESQREMTQNLISQNSDLKSKLDKMEIQNNNLLSQKTNLETLYNDLRKEKQTLEQHLKTNAQANHEHRSKQLEVELQQAMLTIHQQGIRCEELNMEISKLLEEKLNVQQQLQQSQRSGVSRKESQSNDHFVSVDMNQVFEEPSQPHKTESKFAVETSQVLELQQRLEDSESVRQDLMATNASLESSLSRERERRQLIEEELTISQAWNERMGLNSSKDEYHLLLEEEPQMIPETDFSISRQVLTKAYRAKRWLNGRRNYITRVLRRSGRVQLIVYIYLFLIHLWLLTCLF